MVAYTYETSEPEIYDGKRFWITPETGDPFMVSVATDESEIPRLVELATTPPQPAVYTNPQVYPSAEERIQELTGRVEALEATNEALLARIEKLEG